ncbi:MAG: hypothetical protein AAF674_06210 [Pseudomonadota bacterium]
MAGKGLPSAAVETTIFDEQEGRTWQPYPARFAASVPAALATAVRLALGSETWIRTKRGPWMSDAKALDGEGTLTQETAQALEYAVGVCSQMGAPEFLEMSGDLSRLLVRPRGAPLDMISMDLEGGTISVPTTAEHSGTAYQGPLFGFERAMRQHPAVGSYLARARYAVSVAKEDAIYAFRDSAESRIMEFDGALSGRELNGHRLETAKTLVARLQAGLGDTLLGLSEAAQLTALEWALHVKALNQTPQLESDAEGTPRRPQLVR